jgi:hypothetical protein
MYITHPPLPPTTYTTHSPTYYVYYVYNPLPYKVLTAHITTNEGRDGARNAWADEIEREDREAEARKNGLGCDCCLS